MPGPSTEGVLPTNLKSAFSDKPPGIGWAQGPHPDSALPFLRVSALGRGAALNSKPETRNPRLETPDPRPESAGVRHVGSFADLAETSFGDGINALCWPRHLAGDFAEVVARIRAGRSFSPLSDDPTPSVDPLVTLDEESLLRLDLSPAGRVAAEALLADLRLLRDRGLEPVLNCIFGYPADDTDAVVRTDVFSFHADSAPVAADTWLCTYHGSPSEAVANAEARRRVDDPATRAELLKRYGGQDDADFGAWLHDNCYDLHYAVRPGAHPFSFGHFNLWRIAVEYPGSPVPPCIHRAPATIPGEPRLLLIS